MTELRFIGVEDGCLIVSGDDGRQHRVRIDDALREAVRPRPAERREAPKVPPREIQQLIRAGRSVDEVVEMTGAEAADVARFEGPIRAERDYIVEQARSVPVRMRAEVDPLGEGATFGSALDERLETLGAAKVRWDAWKDPEEGWQVELGFAVDELERDARWSYEPKSRSLTPRNPAATTLSQQGELSALHAPRLRAVDAPGSVAAPVERSTAPDARRAHPSGAVHIDRTPPPSTRPDHLNETADLLEALRRRRGEREPLRTEDEDLEAAYDEEFPAPAVPQPHRPPIAFAPRREGGTATAPAAEHDADAPDDLDGGEEGQAPDPGSMRVPNRTSGLTGGIDRIRRGSDGRGSGPGPRVVDVPLDGLDGLEGDAHDAPAEATSDRRRRAAAEREAAARAAAGPSGLAADDADDDHDDGPAEPSARGSEDAAPAARPAQTTTGSLGRRRSRPSMPSWDEIVFGTKRDD